MKIYEAEVFGSYLTPQIKAIDITRRTDKSFWTIGEDWRGKGGEIRHAIGPNHHDTFESAKQWLLRAYANKVRREREYLAELIDEHDKVKKLMDN